MSSAERLETGSATVTLLPSAAGPQNLPVRLTSFVGRERELGELREAVASTRLLTLTGAGGCGKTRLALRAASELAERFPGGIWWVELAPLAEERLVAAAVAESLGVRPLPGMTELQACGAYLAARRVLLVLDNCEHLLDACAEVVESLLKAAPGLLVLATSRAPLGVDSETDWRVPSLSLPQVEADGSANDLARSDAVSLFVERGREARPGFDTTGAEAAFVASICTELDGLPLAIELAAARLRMLSLEQIAARVADRFRLLTRGPRTATERQQTLRASVDWSHELLSVDERVLLRRVSVFAGGFTLEAAEEVCAGDAIDRDVVLDLLASLVDQSLVMAEGDQRGVRFRLLETVRQYGLERLAEAGEEQALRGRHRDFFLELAEQAAPDFETARKREALERLDPEAANLATAIDHALGSEPTVALRFCVAVYRWWWARGRYAEAELAQSRSFEACGEREPALRARVLYGRANTANHSGRLEVAEADATEALALAAEAGDQATAARARSQLGVALQYAKPAAARAELARAAELARGVGDDWLLVDTAHLIAGTYMYQGEHEQAARALDEVAALAERVGDPGQVSVRWVFAGWIAYFRGRFAEARTAIDRLRAVGGSEPSGEALADAVPALIDAWEGEPDRALEHLHAQLERMVKLGAGFSVPWLLLTIGRCELAADRPEQARDSLERLVQLVEGRELFLTSSALCELAEARRVLGDDAAEPTALRAQECGERLGNRRLATVPRLTLGRLAASRGHWAVAQQHALAHLDTCAEDGLVILVPGCLDALAEVAAGLGSDRDAVRMLAAAQRARAEIGAVRLPPEERHWAALDDQLREALGSDGYDEARAEGATLTVDDALEWARRARGPRRRPSSGWGSLTPTEQRVAELVAQGLTNPQIGERMFISKATVKAHLSHIFKKLDLHHRAELSAYTARRSSTR